MNIRRVLIIFSLAVLCALATPTSESEANAACTYPFVRITQYWADQECGQVTRPTVKSGASRSATDPASFHSVDWNRRCGGHDAARQASGAGLAGVRDP